MSEVTRGLSIQVHVAEGFELPTGVADALKNVRVAVAAAEEAESEVEGFAFKGSGPQLRMGELMPKLEMKLGGLSLTCESMYVGTGGGGGTESCTGKFTA